jgi:hypothetical protein
MPKATPKVRIVFLFAIASALVAFGFRVHRQRELSKINDALQHISLGMTAEEVVLITGKPMEVFAGDPESHQPEAWIFARPFGAADTPRCEFDDQHRVSRVVLFE